MERQDGSQREVDILKPPHRPLGLHFEESLICNPRSCANNCVFCFIDQMPEGLRESLYVKDDDWRLSLMMGNFVSLTNVSDREFERIIRRRASPLYVSVHATDPALRARLMRQKRAADLMPRLRRLRQEGLEFHCQVVLCPGLNDGPALNQTLSELLDLSPAALSVALVPVGLTKYRDGLTELKPYTVEQAKAVLDQCHLFQEKALSRTGSRFVFPADELICIAGAPLPEAEAYEGYPQIENGIGMIRLMEEQLREASREKLPSDDAGTRVLIACGTSIRPYMEGWVSQYKGTKTSVEVHSIRNDFFGTTVTVSGLITGQDLARQLHGLQADLLLLPDSMLNADKTSFLDDLSPQELEHILGFPVRALPCTGDALYRALQRPLSLIQGVPHA